MLSALRDPRACLEEYRFAACCEYSRAMFGPIPLVIPQSDSALPVSKILDPEFLLTLNDKGVAPKVNCPEAIKLAVALLVCQVYNCLDILLCHPLGVFELENFQLLACVEQRENPRASEGGVASDVGEVPQIGAALADDRQCIIVDTPPFDAQVDKLPPHLFDEVLDTRGRNVAAESNRGQVHHVLGRVEEVLISHA